MKKHLLLLVAFTAILQYCYSQTARPLLNVSWGIAMPVGSFGKKDIHDNKSGYASSGSALQVAMNFPSSQRVGIAVSLFAQSHALDTKELEKDFSSTSFATSMFWASDGNQTQIPPPTGVTYSNWHFEKKRWFIAGLMGGGYLDQPLSSGSAIRFTAKVLVGAMYVSSPALEGASSEPNQSASIDQENGSGIGFSYSANAGIRVPLNDRISVITHLNYFGGSVKLKNVRSTFVTSTGAAPFPTVTSATNTYDLKQDISSVGLSVGLAFQL